MLQSTGGIPIHCYYHVFAERKDGEKLIPEYEGTTPADYPGNNDQYSISGYHYDVKEDVMTYSGFETRSIGSKDCERFRGGSPNTNYDFILKAMTVTC